MSAILVIGAGRSSTSLISYLLENARSCGWKVTIADTSAELARTRIGTHTEGTAIRLDIQDRAELSLVIRKHDIVISMLPASLHLPVAKECLQAGKHLVTASYVSPEMSSLSNEVRAKDLIFLNEMGLDPGIDHMSAMEVIDRIRHDGGEITGFRSYCGGLVAPESNDNPWGYKFSWNPRNVVLAGQGTAQYREEGKTRFVPYSRLFATARTVRIQSAGTFDAYLNRDSLTYLEPYGLQDVSTIMRGTLRMRGFCSAWNALVTLGLTDDTWRMHENGPRTWAELTDSFTGSGKGNLKVRTAKLLGLKAVSPVMKKLDWLGIFSGKAAQPSGKSPAMLLQELLEEKWKLKEKDKDMVVMYHEFLFTKGKKKGIITSSLVETGKDQVHTAMARTVGLPMGIAVKLIARGKIRSRGVMIPVLKEIYEPVMKELSELGIRFRETQKFR